MIHCLLIQISNNKRGLPVRSYRTITADEVTIGRYVECTVHLADPRIYLYQYILDRTYLTGFLVYLSGKPDAIY